MYSCHNISIKKILSYIIFLEFLQRFFSQTALHTAVVTISVVVVTRVIISPVSTIALIVVAIVSIISISLIPVVSISLVPILIRPWNGEPKNVNILHTTCTDRSNNNQNIYCYYKKCCYMRAIQFKIKITCT